MEGYLLYFLSFIFPGLKLMVLPLITAFLAYILLSLDDFAFGARECHIKSNRSSK